MDLVPVDLVCNQQRRFTGPNNQPWVGWRDTDGKLNYMPVPPDGQEEESQVCITVDLFQSGLETWSWDLTVSGPMDAGDSIITPSLEGVDLETANKAFLLGWRAWCAYLDAQRLCPYCKTRFEIAEKDLDGTLPTHKHPLEGAEEADEDGNCDGSGQHVEDLMNDGFYDRPTAQQLLDAA